MVTIKVSREVILFDYIVHGYDVDPEPHNPLPNTDINKLMYSLQKAGIGIDKSKSQKTIYSRGQEVTVDLEMNNDISGSLQEIILVGEGLEIKVRDFIKGGGTGAIGGDVGVTEGIEFDIKYEGEDYLKSSKFVKMIIQKVEEFYKENKQKF